MGGECAMRAQNPVILVIEPESTLRRLMQTQLAAQEYEVVTAFDGTMGLAIFREVLPDVIISEQNISGIGINALCGTIREASDAPFIVLSSRATEDERVTILDLGADDVIVKPFGIGEFLARVRVAIRHGGRNIRIGAGMYNFQGWSIDFGARQVRRNGSRIRLTPTEAILLSFLVRNAGKALTWRYILQAIWGPACDEREYVRAYIYNLRKKIEADPHSPQFILSMPGGGYQFDSGIRMPECPTCHRPFNQSTNGSSQGTRLVAVNP